MQIKHFEAIKSKNDEFKTSKEQVVVESPLQIKINSELYTMTMRTPTDDNALAVGLLLSEDIINTRTDILNIKTEINYSTSEIESIDCTIDPNILMNKEIRKRSLSSNSSCGICGQVDSKALTRIDKPLAEDIKIEASIFNTLIQSMFQKQSLFQHTGGSHAAAAFAMDGTMLQVAEDIGRHNAVDKVIGSLFLENKLSLAKIMCVSSRASYEIATKCYKAGIPYLAVVSSPSSMAIDFCQEAGISLLAFCRGESVTIYTHANKILLPQNIEI
jgi:FdhD protein